jgi:Glucodextranase, domain B
VPVFINPDEKAKEVEFAWTPMANAAGYRLRISHNPYFSSLLLDRKVETASVVVTGLPVGAYYWSIQSYDGSGKGSVESEKNRFTIVVKTKEKTALSLELDPFIQHGHVIEVTGKTEEGARVMVNGREVPMVSDDGSFHYFTPPLPNGENLITVTAQNLKGGVNTHQEKVVIQ